MKRNILFTFLLNPELFLPNLSSFSFASKWWIVSLQVFKERLVLKNLWVTLDESTMNMLSQRLKHIWLLSRKINIIKLNLHDEKLFSKVWAIFIHKGKGKNNFTVQQWQEFLPGNGRIGMIPCWPKSYYTTSELIIPLIWDHEVQFYIVPTLACISTSKFYSATWHDILISGHICTITTQIRETCLC